MPACEGKTLELAGGVYTSGQLGAASPRVALVRASRGRRQMLEVFGGPLPAVGTPPPAVDDPDHSQPSGWCAARPAGADLHAMHRIFARGSRARSGSHRSERWASLRTSR